MYTFEDTKGNSYKIAFSYERKEVPADPAKPKSKTHSRPFATTCTIINTATGTPIATGKVVVHPKAAFTYEGGRKWSLRRAFEKCNLTRADRAAAWDVILAGKI